MAYKTELVSVTKSKVAGNGYSGLDGEVVNPESATVSLESATGGIGQSSNGRFIVFVSEATNFSSDADTNNARDVFLKDMSTGVLTRISMGALNLDSSHPDVSDDGKYVSFETNDFVYRFDTGTGTTTLVAEGTNSQMSANGQFIVYTGDDGQIYMRDMATEDPPMLISQDGSGNIGNADSDNAFVSNDGKLVVFQSSADNFDAGNKNAFAEVFLKNTETGELILISQTADGEGGVGHGGPIFGSGNAMISGNGRYVVFESGNNDLDEISNVNGTNLINSAIYRKDLITGQIDLVSEGKTGKAAVGATDASITADGRFVLFKTGYGAAQDGSLISAAVNNKGTLSADYYSFWYVKDMATGDVYNIDLPRATVQFKTVVPFVGTITMPATYQPPYQSYNAIISADGKYITLSSTQKLDVGKIPKTVITSEGASFVDNNDEQFDVFRINISSITSKAVKGKIVSGTEDDDILYGGMGTDTLAGGQGNDLYKIEVVQAGAGAKAVAKPKYSVTEKANQGEDTMELFGSVSGLTKASTITIAANVENLDASATGDTWLNITGNALDNEIIGNDANNLLKGLAGADTLIGGAGNDTLDGGAGIDSFEGGAGDDTYVIDSIDELAQVAESEDEGNDILQVTFKNASKTTAVELDISSMDHVET
jgi:Ca2+-binding RTX toxin-like protein